MTTDLTFAAYTGELLRFLSETTAGACRRLSSLPESQAVEFNRLALALFALQFEHTRAYGRFCRARNATPQTVSDWTQIPAVPTAAFKDGAARSRSPRHGSMEEDLTSLPVAERTAVFHSSGTTGRPPSRHFHNAQSLQIYAASLLPWFRAHVLADPAARRLQVCALTPGPAQAPHSSLVYMFDVVRRALGAPEAVFLGEIDDAGAWRLEVKRAVDVLGGMARSEAPALVLGTAFAFVALLDGIKEMELELRLPRGSRALETGGYKGRARAMPKALLHAQIARFLGIPPMNIVSEYGMSELSSQAYDGVAGESDTAAPAAAARGRVFRFPPWARARAVSPETRREVAEGQTGLIVVWDLANVRSVMAVQTEDLGVRRHDGFEWVGRVGDAEPRGCSLSMA